MGHTATEGEINAVVDRVHEIGLKTELSRGEERTLIGVIGANAYAYREAFSHLSGIHGHHLSQFEYVATDGTYQNIISVKRRSGSSAS